MLIGRYEIFIHGDGREKTFYFGQSSFKIRLFFLDLGIF